MTILLQPERNLKPDFRERYDPAFATFFDGAGLGITEPPSLVPEDPAHRNCVLRKQPARRGLIIQWLSSTGSVPYTGLVARAAAVFSTPPCCDNHKCAVIRAVLAVRQLTWHGLADISADGCVYLIPPAREVRNDW